MRPFDLKLATLLVAGMLVALGGQASGDPVLVTFADPLDENPDVDVNIEVLFEYDPSNDGETASITVDLWNYADNTPPGGVGLGVTGFAFNAHPDFSVEVLELDEFTYTPTYNTVDFPDPDDQDMQFKGILSYNGLKLAPYGYFDIAAYNGSNLAGGNPNEGVREGEHVRFVYKLALTEEAIDAGIVDLRDYNEYSFLSEESHLPGGAYDGPANVVVRWADYVGGISGKLVNDGAGEVVPEPVSMLLFGTAMAASVAFGIRKRKKQAS